MSAPTKSVSDSSLGPLRAGVLLINLTHRFEWKWDWLTLLFFLYNFAFVGVAGLLDFFPLPILVTSSSPHRLPILVISSPIVTPALTPFSFLLRHLLAGDRPPCLCL